jgi:hypothetical protein
MMTTRPAKSCPEGCPLISGSGEWGRIYIFDIYDPRFATNFSPRVTFWRFMQTLVTSLDCWIARHGQPFASSLT